MKVVYIDEFGSPELGSSEKYFVIAPLITDSPRIIQSQLKRMKWSLGIKHTKYTLQGHKLTFCSSAEMTDYAHWQYKKSSSAW